MDVTKPHKFTGFGAMPNPGLGSRASVRNRMTSVVAAPLAAAAARPRPSHAMQFKGIPN